MPPKREPGTTCSTVSGPRQGPRSASAQPTPCRLPRGHEAPGDGRPVHEGPPRARYRQSSQGSPSSSQPSDSRNDGGTPAPRGRPGYGILPSSTGRAANHPPPDLARSGPPLPPGPAGENGDGHQQYDAMECALQLPIGRTCWAKSRATWLPRSLSEDQDPAVPPAVTWSFHGCEGWGLSGPAPETWPREICWPETYRMVPQRCPRRFRPQTTLSRCCSGAFFTVRPMARDLGPIAQPSPTILFGRTFARCKICERNRTPRES